MQEGVLQMLHIYQPSLLSLMLIQAVAGIKLVQRILTKELI